SVHIIRCLMTLPASRRRVASPCPPHPSLFARWRTLMVTSRWTAAPAQAASLRRRGAVLERAILDATLEQLSTVGWNGLTMEGVAAGAQTGKAAVYRRWPSKEDLVADALKVGLPRIDAVPDLGSVR